jgi:predicted acylesterase/phospholipase RssA
MTAKRTAAVILSLFLIFAAGAAYAGGGVVLALSGGGIRGLAHIGVLEMLSAQAWGPSSADWRPAVTHQRN